jgi:hypothetical protein
MRGPPSDLCLPSGSDRLPSGFAGPSVQEWDSQRPTMPECRPCLYSPSPDQVEARIAKRGGHRVHRAGAALALGRSGFLFLAGHRPFRFALGAIPVHLDLLAPNCVLEMDSARPAAMKAVAWPPNGNRLMGHGEKPSQRSVSRREVPQSQRRHGQHCARRFRRPRIVVEPLAFTL